MADPVRPAHAGDRGWMLALNNAHAIELSLLDAAELERLLAIAWRTTVASPASAFLVALDQAAAYANPNHAWFRARHARFVYIDRVVVHAAARGRGLAAALYADLAASARAAGQGRLCCEVNSDPPNPASDAFHARQGFRVVGEARLAARGKTVRYLELPLSP